MNSPAVYLREGAWPFPRMVRLSTASGVSPGSGLMVEGKAQFTVSAADPNIGEIIIGRMVEAIFSGCPPWFGIILQYSYDPKAGAYTVMADDGQSMLHERMTGDKANRSGSAGSILRQLLDQANERNPFGMQWDPQSESGAPVASLDVGGQSIFDGMNALAAATGEEYYVRYESSPAYVRMYLGWANQVGFDNHTSVLYRGGYHIADWKQTEDAITGMESVTGFGGGGNTEERPVVVRAASTAAQNNLAGAVVQQASAAYQGPTMPGAMSERVIVLPRETGQTTIAQAVKRELETPLNATEGMMLTVNDRATWPGVGDIVTVVQVTPMGTVRRQVRVLESQPDIGEEVLSVKEVALA